MIYRLGDLIAMSYSMQKQHVSGAWLPCRPHAGPFTWRLKAAWLVLQGKADAVVWPDEPAHSQPICQAKSQTSTGQRSN